MNAIILVVIASMIVFSTLILVMNKRRETFTTSNEVMCQPWASKIQPGVSVHDIYTLNGKPITDTCIIPSLYFNVGGTEHITLEGSGENRRCVIRNPRNQGRAVKTKYNEQLKGCEFPKDDVVGKNVVDAMFNTLNYDFVVAKETLERSIAELKVIIAQKTEELKEKTAQKVASESQYNQLDRELRQLNASIDDGRRKIKKYDEEIVRLHNNVGNGLDRYFGTSFETQYYLPAPSIIQSTYTIRDESFKQIVSGKQFQSFVMSFWIYPNFSVPSAELLTFRSKGVPFVRVYAKERNIEIHAGSAGNPDVYMADNVITPGRANMLAIFFDWDTMSLNYVNAQFPGNPNSNSLRLQKMSKKGGTPSATNSEYAEYVGSMAGNVDESVECDVVSKFYPMTLLCFKSIVHDMGNNNSFRQYVFEGMKRTYEETIRILDRGVHIYSKVDAETNAFRLKSNFDALKVIITNAKDRDMDRTLFTFSGVPDNSTQGVRVHPTTAKVDNWAVNKESRDVEIGDSPESTFVFLKRPNEDYSSYDIMQDNVRMANIGGMFKAADSASPIEYEWLVKTV